MVRQFQHTVDQFVDARCCFGDGLGALACDGLRPDDREALAYHIASKLGGEFEKDLHGEHGLAWTLCEAAGWPS